MDNKNKKFCAVNAKYYKDSNTSGVLGHANREFAVNKNVLPEEHIQHSNFGDTQLSIKYAAIKEQAELKKGRKFQKNSNTLIDAVVILSQAQVDSLISKKGFEWFEAAATQCLREWQLDIKQKYGFEPLGFEFHLDEGYVDKNNNLKSRNYHAHVEFFNYSFELGIQPLRNLKRDDWSYLQDMLAKRFKKMGFDRGKPKAQTKLEHLEKDDYIRHKNELMDKESKVLKSKIQTAQSRLDKLEAINSELSKAILKAFKSFGLRLEKYLKSVLFGADQLEIDKNAKEVTEGLDNILPDRARSEAKKLSDKFESELGVDHVKVKSKKSSSVGGKSKNKTEGRKRRRRKNKSISPSEHTVTNFNKPN